MLCTFAHFRSPKVSVAKQNLLVVDADPRSLRVLEVSLRNAGYNVAGCPSVGKALEILHANKPDLILSDTKFSDMSGFEFVEQLRQNSGWSEIPFMFLSSDGSIESKIRGLELGVQDYLTKPIYIREVIARVGIELSRQTRAGLARKSDDARTRFSGSLSEMSVVDLLQTIDVSRKSGVLTLVAADGQEGMISFDSGAVINARVEDLRGEDAIYRQLLWREGTFDLEFRQVSLSERTVHRTTQALLMEGMRRLDEWSRLVELLPAFDTVLEVDADMLRERLREMPDELNALVRLIDGRRSVSELLRAHGGDHVDALRKVVGLYFEGTVREVGEYKGSIPVLTEVSVRSSAPPLQEGVHTIPGPAGVGANGEELSIPAPPLAPGMGGRMSRAVTARGMRSASPKVPGPAPVPESPSETVAAPAPSAMLESVPSSEPPRAPESAPFREAEPASVPVSASMFVSAPEPAPPVRTAIGRIRVSPSIPVLAAGGLGEEVGPPGSTKRPGIRSFNRPEETDLKWRPAAPPPTQPPRRDTPPGFQATQPESAMYAGGTILNWAGGNAEIERIETVASRETVEVGRWDTSLEELRDDPDVEEAIVAIDSDPPPAPFVRSSPPGAPPVDDYVEQVRELVSEQSELESRASAPAAAPVARKTDEIPPSLRAPRAVRPSSLVPDAPQKPSMLPWALLMLGLGVAVAVYFLAAARVAEPASLPVPAVPPVSGPAPAAVPATESVPAPASASDTDPAVPPTPDTERAPVPPTVPAPPPMQPTVPAPPPVHVPGSATEPAPETEPAADPVPDPNAINPRTGVADTYEAHLALGRKLKRGSRAVVAYRRAIELNPEGGEALAELGRLMLGRQRTREAAGLARRATAVDPGNALGWITLGAARQMRGDREGARQAYQSCAKLGTGPYVEDCRAMLR